MKFVPKTDWKYDDTPTEGDFNRIEQGIADALDGSEPIIQQDTPPDGVKEGRLWLDTSDKTYQGTVFEELKGEIDGHLADEGKHLTQNDRNIIEGALQKSGGRMTGRLDLNYTRTRISKYDDENNHFFIFSDDDSDTIMNIHRKGIRDYELNLYKNGFRNEVLHTGNLGSLGVGKVATGTYSGDETDNRFINIGFTPKFLILSLYYYNGSYYDPNSSTNLCFFAGYHEGGSILAYTVGGTAYNVDGKLVGIHDNGFYISFRNGQVNVNRLNVPYRWTAFG